MMDYLLHDHNEVMIFTKEGQTSKEAKRRKRWERGFRADFMSMIMFSLVIWQFVNYLSIPLDVI